MSNNDKMQSLKLRHDGYSGTQEGPSIDDAGKWLEYAQADIPVPKSGQVLVKVILGNINPSDLHFIKGEYGQPRRAGIPGGFEGVGEVVKAGEGGERLVGKRVAFYVSADGSGSWAQYALTDARSCIPLRDDLRDEDGAALFINPFTAIAMFEEVKKSKSTSFIMTAAASQLGKLLAGLGRDEGINPIGIVRRDEQIEQLQELGCAHTLNCEADGFYKEAIAIIGEEKPRILLDAVADNVSAKLFEVMPNRARWMIYGKLSSQAPSLGQIGQLIFMNKQIEGFWLVNWIRNTPVEQQVEAVAKVQELFASGKWKTDVAEILPLETALDDLPKALSGMNTGKIMIRP